MYGALWRVIPGPAWFKVFFLLVLVAAIVAACFLWVFPAVSDLMPFNDGTLQEDA